MRARPLVHTAVAAVALVTLAGCQKPTPGVTVSSGSTSDHIEATVFCRDGQSWEQKNCTEHLNRVAVVHVKQDEAVRIDVDSALADHGWRLRVAGTQNATPVMTTHYWTHTFDFGSTPVINLQLESLSSPTGSVTGAWSIALVQD